MENRNIRKQRVGVVVSSKMNKTVIVSVERSLRHQKYGKFIKRTSTFAVHDEGNTSHPGDLVKIMETRPISKTKRWRLLEIVKKAPRETHQLIDTVEPLAESNK